MNAAAGTRTRARLMLDSERRRRTVVTPEGIALGFTVASRSSRAGALIIDLIFIGLTMLSTTLLLIFVLFGTLEVGDGAFMQKDAAGRVLQGFAALWIVAMFLFRNAYFLFFELRPRGATPGKRMAGIRIAACDGAQLTAEAVIARNLVRDIELFLPLVFFTQASQDGGDTGLATIAALGWLLVFLAIPLLNRDRLRAGDIVAGSWVVEAPRATLAQPLAAGADGSDGTSAGSGAIPGARFRFGEAELAVYGEYELQTLERVLRDGREDNLVAVAEAICRKIGWNLESKNMRDDERAFLDAYYAQLRARLERGMRFGKRKADKHAGEG